MEQTDANQEPPKNTASSELGMKNRIKVFFNQLKNVTRSFAIDEFKHDTRP